MLRILSSPKTLCNGLTRRDLLEAGGTGMMGLGLADLLAAPSANAGSLSSGGLAEAFGRAKNCIVLFLYGSPSQLETFDMKPEAPAEIRGTMKPIPSSLPGLDVCELLPETAKIMHKTTVVRSLTHPYPIHGVAFAMTGIPAIDVGMELRPDDPKHHPYFGSVVEFVDRQRRGSMGDFPQNVALPFPFSSQRVGEVPRAGPYAAYLGKPYNPLWTEFVGESSRTVYKTLGEKKLDCHDPYVGCVPESFFRMSSTDILPEMSLDRLNRRRSLLEQFDISRHDLESTVPGKTLSSVQQMAFSLLTSSKVAEALDVRRESPETRDLYGMTLFGQSCLAARRMIEAGTRLVNVFWDEYGLAGDAWDTHWNHFERMNDQLMPPFDKAFSGLITDLDQRGMLDDTLVMVMSEHGRTPKINGAQGGGRDHWSQAYSAIFAGGGIARGNVVGSTDASAGEVTNRPVSPKDIHATMYHLLGIDPHMFLPDRATGRPMPLLAEDTSVIPEMLA
ncbi:MAG: DUF1501 domain-containing protein [Planctomycetota bacterium]|nr:DUF1501 domain-containing protein [Planctomycetota bacterium]MDA1214092.1 DUF1501 domain-containing protein [Planctomycetota bacterium]